MANLNRVPTAIDGHAQSKNPVHYSAPIPMAVKPYFAVREGQPEFNCVRLSREGFGLIIFWRGHTLEHFTRQVHQIEQLGLFID